MPDTASLVSDFRLYLIEEFGCPECAGKLSIELICLECRYDAAVEYFDPEEE